MSVCGYMYISPSHAILFKASHWPSEHRISLRPLIGGGKGGDFFILFFFCQKGRQRRQWQRRQKEKRRRVVSLESEAMPGKMFQKSVKCITLKREQGIKGYLRAAGQAVLHSILEEK